MVNIKIHRGTSQIGGTITEIFTENTHIFIDFGSELTVKPEESTDNNMIQMINNAECDAVLFSHYHGDHVGLLEYIPTKDIREKEITLGMGKVARQVLVNIQKTLADNKTMESEERQKHKKLLDLLRDDNRWLNFMDALTVGNEQSSTFNIGDFHVTTIRVDHSAYDSYMFVIEAEGKCIVHTGDFRVHGRLGEGFFDRLKEFMADKKVDVLLMEGTMLGRLDEEPMSEGELHKKAVNLLMKSENKYAFLICSSTNMESLASFHKAVLISNSIKEKSGNRDCKRAMYVNHYVKEQMDLFASAEPDITWGFNKANPFEQQGKINEKLGMSQMEYMKENGFLILLGKSDSYEKYIKPFEHENPLLIYSMWNGYVDDDTAATYDEKWGTLYKRFKRKEKLHTSGHAVKEDLEEMIAIVKPGQAIVPIHTEFKESYEVLKGVGKKVKCLSDGERFEVQ
ncbi:MAG: MBL fold metallo-hydrolase [Agathobacter sp.]|nr:MBL fold metallo-hydrolase [Agathobacter sp.]